MDRRSGSTPDRNRTDNSPIRTGGTSTSTGNGTHGRRTNASPDLTGAQSGTNRLSPSHSSPATEDHHGSNTAVDHHDTNAMDHQGTSAGDHHGNFTATDL